MNLALCNAKCREADSERGQAPSRGGGDPSGCTRRRPLSPPPYQGEFPYERPRPALGPAPAPGGGGGAAGPGHRTAAWGRGDNGNNWSSKKAKLGAGLGAERDSRAGLARPRRAPLRWLVPGSSWFCCSSLTQILIPNPPFLPPPPRVGPGARPVREGEESDRATPEQLLFLRLFCSLMQFWLL